MKYVKTFFRLLLGLFMTYAGISHLTIARQEFVAQVPTWLQFSPGFTDFIVLASGVVEIALGLGMLLLWKQSPRPWLAHCWHSSMLPSSQVTSTSMSTTSLPSASILTMLVSSDCFFSPF